MKKINIYVFFVLILIFFSFFLYNLKYILANDISINFEGEKKSPINVCFIDDYEIDKDSNESHGEKVIEVFQYYTDVSVKGYSHKEVNFNKEGAIILNKCDILNYSMVNNDRSEKYLNNIDDFMKIYKGYLIVASGNKSDTAEVSQWSYIKKNYPEKDWLDRLFIIGQGIVWDSDNNDGTKKMNIVRSHGKEINYIFDKAISMINGENLKGSSYSSPVFASILLNNLYDNRFGLNEKFKFLSLNNESYGLGFKDINRYNTVIFND